MFYIYTFVANNELDIYEKVISVNGNCIASRLYFM
jgi:hypothetical protein